MLSCSLFLGAPAGQFSNESLVDMPCNPGFPAITFAAVHISNHNCIRCIPYDESDPILSNFGGRPRALKVVAAFVVQALPGPVQAVLISNLLNLLGIAHIGFHTSALSMLDVFVYILDACCTSMMRRAAIALTSEPLSSELDSL